MTYSFHIFVQLHLVLLQEQLCCNCKSYLCNKSLVCHWFDVMYVLNNKGAVDDDRKWWRITTWFATWTPARRWAMRRRFVLTRLALWLLIAWQSYRATLHVCHSPLWYTIYDRRTFPGLRHDVQLTSSRPLYVSQHGQLSHTSSWGR